MLPIERLARVIVDRVPRCAYCDTKLAEGQVGFCSEDCALDHLSI